MVKVGFFIAQKMLYDEPILASKTHIETNWLLRKRELHATNVVAFSETEPQIEVWETKREKSKIKTDD